MILPSLSFAPNSRVSFSIKCGGISAIAAKLSSDFGLRAVTAGEIEFYLLGSHERDLAEFWSEVKAKCASADIGIFNIEKERGREQHEVSLAHCANPEKTAQDINFLKDIIANLSKKYSMQADFKAKPAPDDFGSGLHIHIHLEDKQGINQFAKQDSNISDALNHSLGGLLLWMPDTMPIFAPNDESYRRFVAGSNAPITVSWGANNRTVALRLPDSSYDNKRIEHRVSGADADVSQIMYAILAAIHYGLATQAKPDGQVYGDAALDMYNKPRLPTSLQMAVKRMKQTIFPLKNYGILIDS